MSKTGVDTGRRRRVSAIIETRVPQADRTALTAAMDRYADGDAVAFNGVHVVLGPRLEAFFQRITPDHSLAQDLVQQTFFQVHRARQSFVRGSDVIRWVYTIGRRVLIDTHRRRKREVLFASAEDDVSVLAERVAVDESPEDLAVTKEMAARADAVLARLPRPQRTAYQLVRGDGLSVAEAAEVLGTTAKAVKQRLSRAYQALRRAMVPEPSNASGCQAPRPPP
jgi:RNA polymerase sigma-70 factor (ECF subfamily)